MATATIAIARSPDAMDVRGLGDLQTRLRAMSYFEPVTIESAPLVRDLLADLVRASEAQERAVHALETAQREALELSQVALPLRKENATLTRENNSLHLEIIHQEEAIAERERACALQLQSLQDDLKRLQFVNAQKTQQVALKEQEVTKLQIQLERFVAMGTDAPQRALDGASIERRGSNVTLSASRAASPSLPQAPRPMDTTHVVSVLQAQAADLTTENERLRSQLASYDDKLATREREIARLAKLSLATAESDVASAEKRRAQDQQFADAALHEAMELQRAHLETQVDVLNHQVAKYEARLKDATAQIERFSGVDDKLQQADERNVKLADELHALQTKYEALEDERVRSDRAAAATANTKPNDLQSSPPRQSTDALSTELEALHEQLASLTAHRDRLENALRATHYDKISYTNALANANAHNRVLATDLANADAKAAALTTAQTKLQQALADATARNDALTREVDALTHARQQSDDAQALETEKNASLHRELRAIDAVVAQRDEELRALNYALLNQKSEVERLTRKLDALSQSLDADGAESGDSVSRKALAAQEIQWLEAERQELRKSKEELLVQVMNLQDELQAAQSALERSRNDSDKLTQQLATANKLLANAEQALDDKKRDASDVETRLSASREHIRELQARVNESQVLLQRADDSESDAMRVQSEALALRKRNEELRDANASFQARLESSDVHAKRLSEQLERLQHERALATKSNSALELQHSELQRSYESVVSELRSAQQLAQHYQNEFEKLGQELQSHQQSRSFDQSALELNTTTLSELRADKRSLESDVRLKQNALQQLTTRLEQEKLSHRSVQSEFALVQDELLQTKEALRARDATVKQLRDALHAKDREVTEKTESVENFKLLVEQMESSREQLVFKVKTQQQQLARHVQETADLHNKLAALDRNVQTRNSEIASLRKLTRSLDVERDSLTDQLDTLTEKYHEAVEHNTELQASAATESTTVSELQTQVALLVTELNARDDELQQLDARCSTLATEHDRLEQLCGIHEAEMAALGQDLENMTIENQALSEECSRAQFMHQSQSQSSSSLQLAVRQAERARDELAIELEDLRHTYRSLIQDHDAIERARAQVAELHEELTDVNATLRQQVATLETQRDAATTKSEALALEVATYREQVSYLTESLQTSEQVVADRESVQHELEHALETQKQVATEISAQRFGAQAQSAAVAQRIVHLEAKVSNAKFEARALTDKLEVEASERRSLEHLVATLREKIAANDALISHLEEQREAMAHEIQSKHQRRVVAASTTAAGNAMDMSELNHTRFERNSRRPHDRSDRFADTSPPHGAVIEVSPLSTASRALSESPRSEMDRGLGNSATSSSIAPMRSLEEAQRKCQELEDRLTQQDDTIKQLERSRSKFKRFAVKYEREIEQRDRLITELQSSHASSFVSPEPRLSRTNRSAASASSSGSSSSSTTSASPVAPSRRSRTGASAVSS